MNSSSSQSGIARKLIPSPSMLVALLALTVALSGTAYAAAKINGKNIKKGTVASKQIKDKSLLGRDIKDGTVANADLAADSVTSDKIAGGAVANADLAGNAVTSDKIADGTIANADLASGGVVAPPAIGTATSASPFAIPGFAFADVTGMTLAYTAPAGTTKLIITFSAECDVDYTADSQYVTAQILVDGVEAAPAAGANFQFCTVDPLDGYAQMTGASMTRVINAAPGAHTVKVQAAEILLANGTLDDMTLTVVPSS